jgi:UDP-N-acetylglucosamine 2-epimerase (non-hydrolysing)
MKRADLVAALQVEVGEHLRRSRPAAVVVQGDTASAYAGAMAARGLDIPIVHLEAGLRSENLRSPFPEEAYRRRITRIASLHLAPSALAVEHLVRENIHLGRIVQVGSTAIDGLRTLSSAPVPRSCDLLVDVHRRENAGRVLRHLAGVLKSLALSGWRVCIASQPNDGWNDRWTQVLGDVRDVVRLPLLDRKGWLAQSLASRCVLSDSGAAAEELPYVGVPLLIYRRSCERPEGIHSGHARLLSPSAGCRLDDEIEKALRHENWPAPWPLLPESPYGDGNSGTRAAAAIAAWLTQSQSNGRAVR